MDQIRIRGLEVFARHGVDPAEQKLGQKFRINAVIDTDIRRAAAEDDIDQTVNYAQVCGFLAQYMQSHTFRLIETAAERLAEAVLLAFDAIDAIDLEIEKPWAPVGLPLEGVSVRIRRGWETAYLSVGSNLGDRKGYLDGAAAGLRKIPGIRVEEVSGWIETEPYGPVEQDRFLNGIIRIRTILDPHTLLHELQHLEQEAGRERTVHWGPRTLDLDLLFYGEQIIRDEELTVPHPDLENRRFVLEPLAQMDPYFRHPVSGKTILTLYKELS